MQKQQISIKRQIYCNKENNLVNCSSKVITTLHALLADDHVLPVHWVHLPFNSEACILIHRNSKIINENPSSKGTQQCICILQSSLYTNKKSIHFHPHKKQNLFNINKVPRQLTSNILTLHTQSNFFNVTQMTQWSKRVDYLLFNALSSFSSSGMRTVETSEGRSQDYIKNKKTQTRKMSRLVFRLVLGHENDYQSSRVTQLRSSFFSFDVSVYSIVYDEDNDCVYYN